MNAKAKFFLDLSSVFSVALCVWGTPAQILLIMKKKAVDEISGPLTYMTAGYVICMCCVGYFEQNSWVFFTEFLGSIVNTILAAQVLYYKYFAQKSDPPPKE